MVSGSWYFAVALNVLNEEVNKSLNSFAPGFVVCEREPLPEGSVRYGLTHPRHGDLGQVTLHTRGDKQTEMCVAEGPGPSVRELTAARRARIKAIQDKDGPVAASLALQTEMVVGRNAPDRQELVIGCLFDRLRYLWWTGETTGEPTLLTSLVTSFPPGGVQFHATINTTPASFASLMAAFAPQEQAYAPMLDRVHDWLSTAPSPEPKQLYGRLGPPLEYKDRYRHDEFAWVTVQSIAHGENKLEVTAMDDTWPKVEPYWDRLYQELKRLGCILLECLVPEEVQEPWQLIPEGQKREIARLHLQGLDYEEIAAGVSLTKGSLQNICTELRKQYGSRILRSRRGEHVR